ELRPDRRPAPARPARRRGDQPVCPSDPIRRTGDRVKASPIRVPNERIGCTLHDPLARESLNSATDDSHALAFLSPKALGDLVAFASLPPPSLDTFPHDQRQHRQGSYRIRPPPAEHRVKP